MVRDSGDRKDFGSITERPGLRISSLQFEREVHRYQFAGRWVRGNDVLEVACGSGQGLGYLGARARRLVAGDIDQGNLRLARAHYGLRVPLVRLDAMYLPFAGHSFDVIVALEAIYYVSDSARFVTECRRVLRPGGTLVLATVNRAWHGFIRSPFGAVYLDSRELGILLAESGFDPEVYGAFRDSTSPPARARSVLRRLATRMGFIPGSLAARAVLKRAFYGRLRSQPAELPTTAASVEELTLLDPCRHDERHSILYAIGHRVG